jgi:hypothetical protein
VLLDNIQSASLDNKGNLYVGDQKGNLYQYLPTGERSDLLYAPPRPSGLTLIDASNPLRIFAYYQDLQEYVILDRFLTESARYSLTDFTTFSGLCAPSQNNQIWLVDLQSFALKKIDPLRNIEQISVPLEQVLDPESYEITHLQEYQNLVFMSDKYRGIYIFDNLGNLMIQIPVRNVSHFSFSGDDILMATSSKELIRYNLYEGTEQKITLTYPVLMYFESAKQYFINSGEIRIR